MGYTAPKSPLYYVKALVSSSAQFSVSAFWHRTRNGPIAGNSCFSLLQYNWSAFQTYFASGLARQHHLDAAQHPPNGWGLQHFWSWSYRVQDEEGSWLCNGPHQ